MIPKLVINNRCIDCDACRPLCPENSILLVDGDYIIENWSCTLCGLCIQICPTDCIRPVDEEGKQIHR